ncbi:sodium- and chloride-dependent glycine transporter 1-like [Ruditapes philippinarum]|uniref:sodium- and chloride-dependent glycine transporter 1-like n=1 Tax=Ruditapes philippinarum TaxID=129788 RepID=UPI00295AAC5B|nr:sodium- and chloride-dependent glycine transporter 1-like [Ruditapes philippinarum]
MDGDSMASKANMQNGFHVLNEKDQPMIVVGKRGHYEKIPTNPTDTTMDIKFEEDITLPTKAETEKFKFTSTFSTYMTLLGYSIGMSDFWRFPFLAYRNGGGAFLIPFVVMIILCGFPLYFLEYSLSKFSGRGPYKIWDVSPIFRGIGVTIVAAYSLWMIGTTVLRCWIIDFLINAFQDPLPWTLCTNTWNTKLCKDTLGGGSSIAGNQSLLGMPSLNDSVMSVTIPMTSDLSIDVMNGRQNSSMFGILANSTETSMTSAEEFWQYRVLELSSGISDLSPFQWRHVITLVVIRLVIFFGLVKSIKSIEKVIYVTATVPFFLTVAIFIRSLMLPGSSLGIFHFINPDFDKIIQPRVWIEATLMAFYTLGFGWGGNMLLGSHAHFKENCLRTSIILPLANMFMAAFSGLVCFSVLGNMAHIYDVDVTEVINAGMSVGIVAYITALSSLPFPQIWTVCFLAALILTGIDGQLVPMDMLMQLIGDVFPRVRRGFRIHALVVTGVIFFLCSLPTCTGAGAYIFLWMDWYNGAWIGPIVAFIQLVVVAWVYGMDRFSDDVHMMIGRPIPGLLRFFTAFITPLIVLIIFLVSCVEYVPPSYGSYTYPSTARVMGWLSVAIVISPMLVQGLYTVYTSKGASYFKKLKQHLQPMESWGPSEEEFQGQFHINKAKYRNRSWKDLMYYNMFGNYPLPSSISTNKNQELNCLNKT